MFSCGEILMNHVIKNWGDNSIKKFGLASTITGPLSSQNIRLGLAQLATVWGLSLLKEQLQHAFISNYTIIKICMFMHVTLTDRKSPIASLRAVIHCSSVALW